MGPVHFKLFMSDGLTRRISFNSRPSWSELATRIYSFCNIPRNRLAMSYVDSDGDEVTLSSEEELRDFYDSTVDNAIQGNQLIRFRVVELGSLRDADNFMDPISPQPSSTRNTFGRPTPFVFVDHDHPPFGSFGDMFVPSPLERDVDSPHAFVEVLDDDGEQEREFSDVGDKGKARDLRPSISDDISSSKSVIEDETPRKPPIHVQVHSLRPMDSGTFGPPPATSTPARETETPTPRPDPSSESPEEAPRDLPGSFPDPPTPELSAPFDPNVSLSNDLASLLNSLNSMFLDHPQVGQHLRSLFRNAANGSYWNTQRDSVARVAEDIQRVAQDAQSAVAGAREMGHNMRQQARQEAARRVTESVGNIMRAFGASGNEPPPSSTNIPGSAQMSSSTNTEPPPPSAASAPVWNQFRPFPGPPSSGPQGVDPSSSATHPPEVSYYTASTNREARPSTSELKTSLEAAKANYKAEKERYRQEQEIRRHGRWLSKESAANSPVSPETLPVGSQTFTSMAPSDAEASRRPFPSSTVPPPFRQIISNARGRFPQLEMFNVPRTPTKQRGDDKAQYVDTVMERLEVMGFNETSLPTMRTVVESHLPVDGSKITKDVEDDVMTEILEELLETSGSGSGSGMQQPSSSSK